MYDINPQTPRLPQKTRPSVSLLFPGPDITLAGLLVKFYNCVYVNSHADGFAFKQCSVVSSSPFVIVSLSVVVLSLFIHSVKQEICILIQTNYRAFLFYFFLLFSLCTVARRGVY